MCYLATPSKDALNNIENYIELANNFAEQKDDIEERFVQLHWAPKNKTIKEGERAYYTKENGCRIDRYRYFINQGRLDNYVSCCCSGQFREVHG